MKIKTHYYQKGLLKDGLSTQIYDAVVDKGIRNIHQFETYHSQ